MVEPLEDVVARELEAWPGGAVELEVYGTHDPGRIAVLVNGFCRRELGSGVAGGLFYRGSSGGAAGVVLESGEAVVVKAFQPRWGAAFLDAVRSVQSHLARRGFPCAEPLTGPAALAPGAAALAAAERYLPDPGMVAASDPTTRRVSAAGLARQVELSRGRPAAGLADHPLATPARGIYPTPHSPLFDFVATAAGADWIDEFAARATARRAAPVGPVVPAHTDWSARNVRVADGVLVAVYDWDSLSLVPETVAVGQAAATWCVTSEPGGSEFPTAGEAAGFVRDYESARGGPFDAAEWSAVSASFVWVLAYTARCEHALAVTGNARPDQCGATQRLRTEGDALFDLRPAR